MTKLTKDELQALLHVIGESYPIQRKRIGRWEKPIEDNIVSARRKIEEMWREAK